MSWIFVFSFVSVPLAFHETRNKSQCHLSIAKTGKTKTCRFLLICTVLLSLVVFSEPYYVYNFAGNASAGFEGDGGPATSAELNSPYGVAVSINGEVYVADTNNNRIRVVYPNGTINTFAGDGDIGYAGDDGPATNAKLSFPRGVAVSPHGNVYIADTYNSRIRVIYTNNTICTFAGTGTASFSGDRGPATRAELNSPYDVDVSSTGEVYIADNGNQRIRIVYTNGTLTNFLCKIEFTKINFQICPF